MGSCLSSRSFKGSGQRLGTASDAAAVAATAPPPGFTLDANPRTAGKRPTDLRSAAANAAQGRQNSLAAAEARQKAAQDRGTNEANANKGVLAGRLAKAPTSASVNDRDAKLPERIVYD